MVNSIAVIGGGYSGISIVLNLARLVTKPTKVFLFEKSPHVALGAAYSTTNPSHLLNVRANNMSAFPDLPNHFVEWLEQDSVAAQYLDKTKPIAQQFLPRCIYGRYLQMLWQQLYHNAHPLLQVDVIHEEVIDIERLRDDNWKLTTGLKAVYQVDAVVLSTGNPAPRPFAQELQSGRIVNNPWQDGVLQKIATDDTVLIIGTGLTMVDMVMSLHAQHHKGKIIAIARRACVPQRHQLFEMENLWEKNRPKHLRTFAKTLRDRVRQLKERGASWHTVVDALRPYTQEVWQSFSLEDQSRFLRHLVPYWDTHRHRIAEEVADIISHYQQSGQLQIVAGRIQKIEVINEAQLKVEYTPRGQHAHEAVVVNWVVNCTGPNTDYSKMSSVLFGALLQKQLIAKDDLRLGLRTNSMGQLLNANDKPLGNFYTLAAVCKPLLWECIAVPDIRQQSFVLAKKLAEL